MSRSPQTDDPLREEVTRLMAALQHSVSDDWNLWQKEWEDALPEKERGHCRLARLMEDCAVIEVDSSLRRYRYWLMRNRYLKWLQQRNPAIKKIVFTIKPSSQRSKTGQSGPHEQYERD